MTLKRGRGHGMPPLAQCSSAANLRRRHAAQTKARRSAEKSPECPKSVKSTSRCNQAIASTTTTT
jgi:hypothetical protein